MIIDFDTIAYDFMTDFNGPSRHFPNRQYPSGVYDEDKTIIKFGPESTNYPNLRLPCHLYDQFGNEIPDGFYMVVLSDDLKYLEFYQSNEMKARVKVIKLVEKMYTQEELDEEAEITPRMHKYKNKNLKKYRKAEEDLIGLKDRVRANSYAEIEDSGKGYYIITYNYNEKKATGIIQK